MIEGPLSSWSLHRGWNSPTHPAAGLTVQPPAVPSRQSTGSPSMVRRLATLAAFVECYETELWCCFPSQPEPIDKTSTAQSIAVWLRIVSVGLFRATFKWGLVSEILYSWKSQLKHDKNCIQSSHTTESYTITFPAFMYLFRPFASSSTCFLSTQGFSRFPLHSYSPIELMLESTLTLKQIIIASLKILSIRKLHLSMHKGFALRNSSPKENVKWLKLWGRKPFLLISAHFYPRGRQWLGESQRQKLRRTTWFWWINSKKNIKTHVRV